MKLTIDIPPSLMYRIELARSRMRVETVVIKALHAAFPFTAPRYGEPASRRRRPTTRRAPFPGMGLNPKQGNGSDHSFRNRSYPKAR